MPSSVALPPASRQRESLEVRRPPPAKAGLKFVATSGRVRIGRAIEAAIRLANRTQKETWAALDHRDGAQLSRWIAGTERPHLDELFAVAWLRKPLVVTLAQLAGGVEVVTEIRFAQDPADVELPQVVDGGGAR